MPMSSITHCSQSHRLRLSRLELMREAHETAQTLYQVKHGILNISDQKNGCCVSPNLLKLRGIRQLILTALIYFAMTHKK